MAGMPVDAFLKNITEHRVHTISTITPNGEKDPHNTLDFDRDGKLTSVNTNYENSTIQYDDLNRVSHILKISGIGKYGQATIDLTYDKKYSDVVILDETTDGTGSLRKSRQKVRKIGSSTILITKLLDSNGKWIQRKIKKNDSLFVYQYFANIEYGAGEGDNFIYDLYVDGLLRQTGVLETKIYKGLVGICPAPFHAPFFSWYANHTYKANYRHMTGEYRPYREEYRHEHTYEGRCWGYLVAQYCYTYDDHRRIIEKRSSSGSLIKYEYDAAGHLTSIIQSNTIQHEVPTTTITYNYNSDGLLISRTDNHNTTLYGYTFY